MIKPIPAILALFGVQPFFVVTALAALLLVVAILFGAVRWQQPKGKAITIVAGVLLLFLAVFVGFVLFIARSAGTGAPM